MMRVRLGGGYLSKATWLITDRSYSKAYAMKYQDSMWNSNVNSLWHLGPETLLPWASVS